MTLSSHGHHMPGTTRDDEEYDPSIPKARCGGPGLCPVCSAEATTARTALQSGRPRMYVKKPVKVYAMQWDGSAKEAGPIIDWILRGGGSASYREVNETEHRQHAELRIRTLEGVMIGNPYDYIIKGVQGEFYPCKPDIFAETYEEV